MAAEFKLLGEVEACVDGHPLDIGHARQRCVLASLLVDVNKPVSVDQLIDRVWSAEPPHRARNALAGYLSRLRTLLADASALQITRGPAGYTLTAEALSVDLHLFRYLAAEARSTADPHEATGLFGRALDLWRGEPFAALDTPWISDYRTSLEAERLSVVLDRNDVALRAGQHTELLDEMTTAHHGHPLDERLAGQLMVAQYRCGRQADALETYRRMRERLIDELGVDPSPPLREIHQQILESDSFAAPSRPPSSPSSAVGGRTTAQTNVPRRTKRFIGRDREVASLRKALNDGPLITLTGVGGVGKTRLALEVADCTRESFADGAWFCELAPLADGAAVGHSIASALRLQQGPHEADEAVVDYLRARELLLVVDNCEHVLFEAAQLVDRIVRDCPRVSVLATSREPLGTEGERITPISPLPAEDAAELFAERARAARPDFDADNEPVGAVAEICRRLDGVPLAIELAAARMRAMSSLDVARRLDRLRLLSGGARGAHPRQQSVAATIDWSYHLLDEREKALFDRLSVFAGGFDLEAVHGVCADAGQTEDDILDLLTGLVDKSMVFIRSGGMATRYGVLETLRAYGRERLQDKALTDDIAARHARYYIELVERSERGMHSADERAWVERMAPNAGTRYASPDFENLRTAFEHVMSDGDIDLALRLVTSLIDLMNRVGYHAARWAFRVVDSADHDHPLFVSAVGVAARAAWVLGDFPHARSLADMAAGRVAGERPCYLAHPDDVLADIALYDGDAETALAHYEAELPGARSAGDPIRLVMIVDRITMCHRAFGAPEAGVPYAEEAIVVADAAGVPTARSLARCALGRALARADPPRALALLEQANEIGASVDNNWCTGMAGMEAAAIRAVHGDPIAAAPTLIPVLDHWEHGGPGLIAQQWDTLRHVARLLVRLGAENEAATLQRFFVDAGREPPLSGDDAARVEDASATVPAEADVVEFARAALRPYC
ncbi:BTAD domain-containing putative transcriptional regulator [Mycobacterium sp. ITM-2016-00318]|uniref:BTAD domain-containing putative transcriptional regulator n=1 Tax=Mycobacterium sp. ITM-2016-00318 TaxID=2099693 RepID=UPI000CF98BE4|nr:BTAD domain-containing putative transcriptional regulator [Mycobacterium sp. ITM-2016-00318]WNG94817.1 BTAD domain-containing putative transcriptional regulator [Mycobacterium sp. ITM-2016-00318]